MSSRIVDYAAGIPKVPFFVFAIDDFHAEDPMFSGKTEVLVFPCESREQAEIVKANALARGDLLADMVHIRPNGPTASDHVIHTLMDPGTTFYQPNGFKYEEPGPFNGLTNSSTHQVIVMLDSDYESYQRSQQLVAADKTGNSLRQYAMQQVHLPNTPMYNHFQTRSQQLDVVNWSEVTDHYEALVQESPKLQQIRASGIVPLQPALRPPTL